MIPTAEQVTSDCPLWRDSGGSSLHEHLKRCERCQARMGRWMATGPVGEKLLSLDAPGRGRVEVRRAAGLCWVLLGERLEAVEEDEAQALDFASRLWVWLATPHPHRVRVRRVPEVHTAAGT